MALNFYSVSYAEHHDLSKDENVTWGYFTDQEMKASRDPSWLKGQCTFSLPTCQCQGPLGSTRAQRPALYNESGNITDFNKVKNYPKLTRVLLNSPLQMINNLLSV